MQTEFTPNVIPYKHTEKVKLNEKLPGKKLGCVLGQVWYLIVSIPDLFTVTYLKFVLSVFSVEYKTKKINFFGVNL